MRDGEGRRFGRRQRFVFEFQRKGVLIMSYDPTLGRFLERDTIGSPEAFLTESQTNSDDGSITSTNVPNVVAHAIMRAGDVAVQRFGEEGIRAWWLWQYTDGANQYQFVASNPVRYTDPSGWDVWIEDGSSDDIPGHQRLGVGVPGGACSYYSFGLDNRWQMLAPTWWRMGTVYADPPSKPVPILINPERYLKTTLKQDADFTKVMNRMVGQQFTYGLTGGNCRGFVSDMLDLARRSYGPPPPPPPPPNTDPDPSTPWIHIWQ